jgi:anti-sigma regulatory factor (Ser/Thr protein kinase)
MFQTTTTAPLISWSRAFPGTPEQVREARQFLAGILGGSAMTDDALLCLSELATNAAVHSRSGEPGGQFRVRVERHDGHVRVEVSDQGGPWAPPASRDGQHGRGLLVVARLARDSGRSGDEHAGWTAWFEIEAS